MGKAQLGINKKSRAISVPTEIYMSFSIIHIMELCLKKEDKIMSALLYLKK
jgi:hypothetical protein